MLSTSSSPASEVVDGLASTATLNESLSIRTTDEKEEIKTLKALLNEAIERIRTLEDVCVHLNSEMAILKKLVTVQVQEVNNTIDCKFKEIIKNVDSKIMQTEQRVDQVLCRFETAQEEFNKSRAESVKKMHHSVLVTPKKTSLDTSHNRSDLSLPPFSPIFRNSGIETPRSTSSKDRPGPSKHDTTDIEHFITFSDDTIVKVLESEMFENYKGMFQWLNSHTQQTRLPTLLLML